MQPDSSDASKNDLPIVLSFDIDGTMKMGDPPGPVTGQMVRRARELGFLIGSCSDRPVGVQEMLWRTQELVMDFVVIKHQLPDVMARFKAKAYYHIGDRELDQQFAGQAGFGFFWPDEAATEPWANDDFGSPGSMTGYGIGPAPGGS
jgi:hypothetical protein